MRDKFKWWERLSVQAGLNFNLLPNKDMTWKQWAFDPSGGLTVPGQEITSRWQLPTSTSWDLDATMIETVSPTGPAKFKSRVLWLRGAVRILGLDIGAGIYFRPSPFLKPPTV